MSRRTIEVNVLSKRSINSAIKELRAYKKELDDKYEDFLLKLGIKIEDYLNGLYDNAMWFNRNYAIDVDPSKNGLVITASGESVAFIEFGAGVSAGNGKYELPHEAFYAGSWSEEHANTYWEWEHSNTPNVEYRWNQDAVHGFDGVIDNMHRWIKETADEVFGK